MTTAVSVPPPYSPRQPSRLRRDDLRDGACRNGRAASEPAPVVEFSDRNEIQRWLAGKPREWAVAIAGTIPVIRRQQQGKLAQDS